MKIAITGSSGFIGAHLCTTLAREHEIVPVSRSSHGDFYKIDDWAGILEGCDAVIHLAAQIHAQDETPDVMLTQNIVDGAIKAGLRDFIFLSSGAVYGATDTPASEDAPLTPSGTYGRGKVKAEEIIMTAQDKIRTIILRPPLVYGAGCHAKFLSLAKAVQKNIPLPLASVKNSRSFLYVGNLSDFIVHALSTPDFEGVYNVADNEPLSTPQLIRMMANIMNNKARLFPVPVSLLRCFGVLGLRRQIDGLIGSFMLDCTRAKNTGWAPPYKTHDGITATLPKTR